jgi:hypothetical protein
MAISSDVGGCAIAAAAYGAKDCSTLTQSVNIPMILRTENTAKLTHQE